MSKTKKEKKPIKRSRKILLRIGIALLTVLLLYTIAWGLNYYKYYKWVRMTGYDEKRHDYVYVEDGYMYAAFTPDHFYQFRSNFSICHSIGGLHEKEDVYLNTLIWPRFGGSYDIGVEIMLVEWNEKRKQFEYTGYSSMLDENFDLDLKGRTEFTERDQKVIQAYYDNREELYHLLRRAREIWGILKGYELGNE